MVNSNPDSSESQQAGSQSPSDVVQPSMTMHPITYSGMPTMHMYPFPPGMVAAQPPRTKRRQVKNACTNCQKACKKCDDARPCLRCVKYGIAEECIDSQRKERQKGIKRGPYKKRDGKSKSLYRATSAVVDQSIDISVQSGIIPAAVAATSATPPIPYVAPMGYSPGFYGQYPAAPAAKPGEAPLYYPQFYIAPMPALPPTHAPGQEGEPTAYPAPQFFPTFITPYAQPYPHTYMLPRPDGQIALAAPAPYAPYPQVYPKHVIAREANGDMPHAQVIDQSGRREMRLENGRMGEGLQQGAHGKST